MNLRTLLTACGAVCTLAACALNSPMPRAPVVTSVSSEPESKPVTPVSVAANQYLVQKGDTLYSIGRKFGIPFIKLAEFNQLQSPYAIHVGQILNLTAKNSTTTTNRKAADPVGAEDAEVVTSTINRPDMSANTEATSNTNASAALKTTTETEKSATPLDLEAINDSDIQWQWPLTGKVSAGFDVQTNKGLNITGSGGQPVYAAGAGKVIYSGMDVRGYGKLIILKHNNNLLSVYAHQGNSLVKEGVFVTQGEKLATLPTPANNKLPMLHFEIRQKGKPVDPATFLPSPPTTASSH